MQTIFKRSSRILLVSLSPLLLVCPSPAHADIFQWEYINPADPSQGKRQSTTLAPGGAGVDAVPGARLDGRNLTMAYLIGADLRGATASYSFAYGDYANLTHADLSHANLTNTLFSGAKLTGANFTGAEVRGANFEGETSRGFTASQLYATASYQAQDLTGIRLWDNDLSGWNFVGQNLTGARFNVTTLTGADFTGAEIQRASFSRTTLFGYQSGTGITPAQLYSTASYHVGDLSGIDFGRNDLLGGNFAGQNLANANFADANLTSANFREAYLANAHVSYSRCNGIGVCLPGTTLAYADLTAADARGASGLGGGQFASAATNTTTNMIQPNGHIFGLNLDADGLLVVRDYDGNPNRYDEYGNPDPISQIPITVDQHLTMAPGGTLRMVFEADAWDSTISFAPGIPVALGGTLELTFAADTNLASQVGRTFDLFDWTGVNPTGAFEVSSPYAWDLSNLYTTGQVTLTAVPEPSSIALAAVVGAFYGRRLRRRKSASETRPTVHLLRRLQ
jgi:uncharacterized protein YjbI with pentapeptide repeats